jgi:hypothetical protein
LRRVWVSLTCSGSHRGRCLLESRVSIFFSVGGQVGEGENIGLSVQLHGESQIRRVAETEMKDCLSFLTAQYVPVGEDGNTLEGFGWC